MQNILKKYLFHFICLYLAFLAVWSHKPFWMSPMLIPALFFSIRKGWKMYICSIILLVSLSFVFSNEYVIEVSILIGVYTFCEMAIHFALKNNKYDKSAFLIMQILILLLVLLKNLSFENIKNWMVHFLYSVIVLESLSELFKKETNRNEKIDQTKGLLAISVLISAFSVLGFIGQCITQVALWFIYMSIEKEKANTVIISSFLMNYLIFNIGFYNCLLQYLPLILIVFIRKEKMYPCISFPLLFLLDTPFYLNAHFYFMILMTIFIYTTKESYKNKIKDFYQWIFVVDAEKENSYHQGLIQIMKESINDNGYEKPDILTKNYVLEKVCNKCPHIGYCQIINNIGEYIKNMPSGVKKTINETCITPYKLSLSIQQANKIFYDVNGYYNRWIGLNRHYLRLLDALQLNESKLSNRQVECARLKDSIYGKYYQKTDDGFCLSSKISEEIPIKAISEMCPSFTHIKRKKNFLLFNKTDFFRENEPIQIEVGIVSKSLIDGCCGDSYSVVRGEDYFRLILSDGMGHGERASQLSRRLVKIIQLEEQSIEKGRELIELANDFMILKNKEEYATLDYVKIDLYRRKMFLWKAGSFTTYFLSNNKIKECKKSGLPIGILDTPSLEFYEFSLNNGDCFVFVTDGIKEKNILFLPAKLSSIPLSNMSNAAKEIYSMYCPKDGYKDDVTIITMRVV